MQQYWPGSAPVWGPFSGPTDAAENLCKFTDGVLGPGFGVAWISGGKLYTIRRPAFDGQGYGDIVVFEFADLPPPTTPPAPVGQGISGWFSHMVTVVKDKVVGEVQAAGNVIENGFARVWHNATDTKDHKMDGVGVALDVVGVAASLVLMSFGPLEVLGVVALVGGAALFVMDGASYVTELAGHDKMADNIKHYTFFPRCLATLASLPDAVWGVGKVVLDGAELAAKGARSLSTADRAAADASRVAGTVSAAKTDVAASKQAALAQRYASIGLAAQKRASAAHNKLRLFIACQSAGRAVIPPGVYFLTKETVDDPERRGAIQRILSRYVFHVSAVHKT